MQRITYMMRKEFKQIFRDRPMIAIIFIVPIIQLLILSYAITTEVKHIRLVILDYDNSTISREITRAFSQTERFDIVPFTDNLNEIDDLFQAWKAQMALVIPQNFARDLQRKSVPQIHIAVDGVDGNTAGIAMGYAQAILLDFGIENIRKEITTIQPISLHITTIIERFWYNLELDSQQFMIPGIVVILLTIIPMMLSAMSLVKEKEIGTLEQLLVTPLKKHQLLLGKLIPFLILAYIEMAIVMSVAILLFNIPMNGSYFLLACLSFLYLLTTIGLGIFISSFTHTQQQAMFVAWFFMVFMIIMSGFFIPIENMPVSLQKVTYLNPMRYFMSIIRDIFQKGSNIYYLWQDSTIMSIFSLIIFTFSVLKFQKRAT
jgi:ABC-2 type transport system permease protein